MTTTVLLRARAIVTTAGDCTCDYDTDLHIGWTCDGCLAVADDGAELVDLADL